LYEDDAIAGLHVRIADGGFDLADVNGARGFGTALRPDLAALEPLTL
jgi:hypothetical protein